MTVMLANILPPLPQDSLLTADQALLGPLIPAHQRILLYSSNEWEGFIHEWAHYGLKTLYTQVQRMTGAGDRGIDVAGFTDGQMLQGIWDNYQCKHYGRPLSPTDAYPELGKMLWYSFNGEFRAPRRYYFIAPREVGTTLAGLLGDAAKLKAQLIGNWDKNGRKGITDTQEIPLDGPFRTYVEDFDFTIFGMKTVLEIVELHKHSCPYHTARFGGGLPARPAPDAPPAEIAPTESRYIEQLYAAYAEHTKTTVQSVDCLKPWPKLKDHLSRQRIAFYYAESLRVFARDTVPSGTFESLQDEIHTGVIDTHDAPHPDGYARVRAVTKVARELPLTSNALITRAKRHDMDGICHQLANEDRLQWTDS
jgi:hypothetical protein